MSEPRNLRRVAIVSGAHQGIGRAVACRLASAGYAVWCADIQNCRDTIDSIRSAGGLADSAKLDTTNADDWARAQILIANAGKPADILVNVAGVLARGEDSIASLSESDWDFVNAVNLKGLWYGMRAALPAMINNRWGRIVNISSMAALKGQDNLMAYSTTKAGVIGMTQQAAVQYAHHGITINAVAPGVANTPILQSMTPELRAKYADNHLIKRLVEPSEIAALIAYLVSEEAGFVTGQTFRIDGGATIS
jgi:NAD(P)-dependent dehydrogenase (short-subunit alcohol dehydrogenase family)